MPPSNSQLIQQLQTPRINKASNFLYGESSFKPDSLRKMQPSIPEQTPIKSLQFMGSKNKQNTKDRDTYKKQVGRVFGRYDFQNGAVYEGQFSEENQFEGNLYLIQAMESCFSLTAGSFTVGVGGRTNSTDSEFSTTSRARLRVPSQVPKSTTKISISMTTAFGVNTRDSFYKTENTVSGRFTS